MFVTATWSSEWMVVSSSVLAGRASNRVHRAVSPRASKCLWKSAFEHATASLKCLWKSAFEHATASKLSHDPREGTTKERKKRERPHTHSQMARIRFGRSGWVDAAFNSACSSIRPSYTSPVPPFATGSSGSCDRPQRRPVRGL